MDATRIAEIRERLAKRTQGEWVRWKEHAEVFLLHSADSENERGCIEGYRIAECSADDLEQIDGDKSQEDYALEAEANAELTAHSPADIRDLLERVEELESRLQSSQKGGN